MRRTFEVVDYLISILTLSVSIGISIYFGCCGNKQKNAKVYLYGSGNLKSIPIGLSLLSSAMSALAIVGTVQEMYVFGTQMLMCSVGIILGLGVTWNLILPVFCGNLNLKGPYEYFERRFNSKVRLLLSIIYVLHFALFNTILLYVSTISFSEASGIELYICTTVIGIICTIYTLLGGFAGVIWTDVLQVILMYCSCFFIMIQALNLTDGFVHILYEADKVGRLQLLNLNPDPFVRLTFWSAMSGMFVIFVAHSSCAASGIQRFLALRTEKEARLSTAINAFGFIVMYFFTGTIALCLAVYYKDCDPINSKKIENPSQILAYFVNEITTNTVGFTGLFTAGLLSAGLSTLSAELNTVSGLFYYDILVKIFKLKDNETRATFIMKTVILLYGILAIIFAPIIQNFQYIFQLGFTIFSWTYGAKFGVMILGTTFPRSNSWGAFFGIVISILTTSYISLNAMYLDTTSAYAIPRSIANCTDISDNFTEIIAVTSNSTIMPNSLSDDEFSIFKLSYMYYSVLGLIITIVIGLLVSCITGGNDLSKMDQRLIIPSFRQGYCKKRWWHKIFVDDVDNNNNNNFNNDYVL